jgi:hypothetical protein
VVDILQVLEGLAYVGFIAGAIFAVYELRSASKDRKTDMMMRFNEWWCRPEWAEPLAKLWKTDFKNEEEAEKQMPEWWLLMIADYFDGVAALAKWKLFDRKFLQDNFAFELSWNKLKPWAVPFRERQNNPRRFAEFEWMANRERTMRLAAEQKGKGV